MAVAQISLYEPAWVDAGGARRFGWDEDEMTAAVEALSGLGAPGGERRPAITAIHDPAAQALDLAPLPSLLGLGDDSPADVRVGGAATMLACLAEASPRVLVAVDHAPTACSAAAVVTAGETDGIGVQVAARSSRAALPAVTDGFLQRTSRADPRLVRDRVLTPLLGELLADVSGPVAIVGTAAALSGAAVRRLPQASRLDLVTCVEGGGARALHVLADVAGADSAGTTTLIGVDPSGHAVSARISSGEVSVTRTASPTPADITLVQAPEPGDRGGLPLNSAGYVRDHLDKALLRGTSCTRCGSEFFPPRRFCSSCRGDEVRDVALPRRGEVVSSVVRHVSIPGLPHPMGLAIVKLDGSAVSVMTHVTDGDPSRVAIGDRGSLRLRRIATRAGVPDYAQAFRPSADPASQAS